MNVRSLPARERGMSLIIVLLFLVILTGLGVTAIRTATIEEKISGNDRDRQIAFEAAEAALRDGEREVELVLTATSGFDPACTNALCLPATVATPNWLSIDWSGALPRVYGTASGAGAYPVTNIAQAPRYIIELLPNMPPGAGSSLSLSSSASSAGGTPYRITAVGWGRRLSTQVMLQSVFVKP